MGAVSASTLTFQSSWNPGFRRLARETLASDLTHDDRCAS
jgi:hypothetical protein